MTAAVESAHLLDPTRAANIPVTLGEHLSSNRAHGKKRTANVQWNYKPSLTSNRSIRIRPSKRRSNSHVDLTIEDQQTHAKYHYGGAQQSSGACALIYNPSSKKFVLDRLDVDFTFNLQTTPANKRRKDVTNQYPQLDIGVSDNESDEGRATALASDDVEHAQADANNPYDYRHFLKGQRTSSPEAPRLACATTSPNFAL
ncbi:MAG: hypothetical protein Q9174_005057 [Haloplaca sp. 1 TL-2023]